MSLKKVSIFLLAAVLMGLIYLTVSTVWPGSLKDAGPIPELAESSTHWEVLAEALTYPTISHKPGMRDTAAFKGFHRFLKRRFPLLHQQLRVDTFGYSLMYTWEGQQSQRRPLVLLAHQDVVPVEYSSEKDWVQGPFAGKAQEEYLYGRGTLDDKGALIAILSAVEELLEENHNVQRSLIICLGHDEEIGGAQGAARMSAHLAEAGVKAGLVVDEGGTLSIGIIPGIAEPVALVGTSEKGYVSLEMLSQMPGGHSSMPEARNAVTALHSALNKLLESPPKPRFTKPLHGFMNEVGPHLPFTQKMAFAHRKLFKPLIFNIYNQRGASAALLRTTQVATILQAGIKDNVIPTRARAVVNYRLLPGDSPQEILARARKLVADSSIMVRIYDDFAIAASPVSPDTGYAYRSLQGAIKAVHGEHTVVAPYLVLGATDGRHYYQISEQVYRFSPFPMRSEDLPRIHGLNERIALYDFKPAVQFYKTLILNY